MICKKEVDWRKSGNWKIKMCSACNLPIQKTESFIELRRSDYIKKEETWRSNVKSKSLGKWHTRCFKGVDGK